MGQLPCRQYGYSARPAPKKLWKIWQARQGNKSIEKLHFGKPSKTTLENMLENYLKHLMAHSLPAMTRQAQNNTCLHNLCCPPPLVGKLGPKHGQQNQHQLVLHPAIPQHIKMTEPTSHAVLCIFADHLEGEGKAQKSPYLQEIMLIWQIFLH